MPWKKNPRETMRVTTVAKAQVGVTAKDRPSSPISAAESDRSVHRLKITISTVSSSMGFIRSNRINCSNEMVGYNVAKNRDHPEVGVRKFMKPPSISCFKANEPSGFHLALKFLNSEGGCICRFPILHGRKVKEIIS